MKTFILKLQRNYQAILKMIEFNQPAYKINKRIEESLIEIEMSLRIDRMSEVEANDLFELEDDLRELYNTI